MWDFLIVDRLHILYASLLVDLLTIPILHPAILYRRVLRLLLYDPGKCIVVRANLTPILTVGPAALD